MIDYDDKGLKPVTSTYSVRENLIHNYFSDVFQAKRLEKNPTVADIKHTLEAYNVYIPVMDDDVIFDELNDAIQNNGRGTGLDSIDKRIAVLFTFQLLSALSIINSDINCSNFSIIFLTHNIQLNRLNNFSDPRRKRDIQKTNRNYEA